MELVEKLTATELLGIREDAIKRIIKETGENFHKSRNRTLRLAREHRTGNKWNATIEAWNLVKGRVWIDFYLQHENSDTNTSDTFTRFVHRGEYRGELQRDDRYGNPRTYHFSFEEGDKARAIRCLLLDYINKKYHDKLFLKSPTL